MKTPLLPRFLRSFLPLLPVAACAFAGPDTSLGSPDSPLKLKVYNASVESFHVASVIVSGPTEAVLIDAQFTLADAHRVTADLLASGKKLTTVYISHGDPDYYFGLEVVRQAFPQAKVYASPATLEHIKKTLDKKLAFWGPKLGANGPKAVVLPEVLPGDHLLVDGQRLEIVGLKSETPDRTFVHIPSLHAVVGGILLYGDLHLWMADAASPEARQQWLAILDRIEALQPRIVVPGHHKPGFPLEGTRAIAFCREYLKAYDKLLPQAKDSAALMAAVRKEFPSAGLDIALEIGAKVNKGEMKW